MLRNIILYRLHTIFKRPLRKIIIFYFQDIDAHIGKTWAQDIKYIHSKSLAGISPEKPRYYRQFEVMEPIQKKSFYGP